MKSIIAGLAGVALLAAAPFVAAQTSKNAQLLARFDPTSSYNDIWGYESATGEYAILGGRNGTYFVDCSNPSQPVQLAFFASNSGGSNWSNSTWRDMKVFGNYAYVVTEGGAGMKIFDMTNPTNPQFVKMWGTGTWTNAHNIAMDFQNGIAYVCGTRSGMHIIDVKTDPINPTLITTFRTPYIHDLSVQDNIGYLSDQNGNRLLLIDVSNLPSTSSLSSTPLQGRSVSHNTWPTADGTICATTNESSGGPTAFYDVSNKLNPQLLSTFLAGSSSALPHNVFIQDRVAYISHYSEGLRCVDISNPTSPREVAYYDTTNAWGCYPFTSSGTVYISDISSGLYLIKPRCIATRYGTGTPASGGTIPAVKHFGSSYLGNGNFRFEVREANPNTIAYLLIGLSSTNANIAGLTLNVALANGALLPATTDANGFASIPIGVPNIPALDGTKVYSQWFVTDVSGPLGLSASRGMVQELFLP